MASCMETLQFALVSGYYRGRDPTVAILPTITPLSSLTSHTPILMRLRVWLVRLKIWMHDLTVHFVVQEYRSQRKMGCL